jgi:secretion/DNA translocation related TadE-like protein
MNRSVHLSARWWCAGALARARLTDRTRHGLTADAICAQAFDPSLPGPARMMGERGAATLIALSLSALVIITAVVMADLGALAAARAQAQTAADLAALAAVTPAGGRPAAARAGEIAAANGAHLTRCRCQPLEATVAVRRRVLLAPFGVAVEVRAYARAVLAGPETAAPAAPAAPAASAVPVVPVVPASSLPEPPARPSRILLVSLPRGRDPVGQRAENCFTALSPMDAELRHAGRGVIGRSIGRKLFTAFVPWRPHLCRGDGGPVGPVPRQAVLCRARRSFAAPDRVLCRVRWHPLPRALHIDACGVAPVTSMSAFDRHWRGNV